tara:strand:+ start:849 stop:989 length:141 start_codon:yes stop_codon:yes gene_type:complete
MNRIPLEEGRAIAERLLEEALIRLDIGIWKANTVCNIVQGLQVLPC